MNKSNPITPIQALNTSPATLKQFFLFRLDDA